MTKPASAIVTAQGEPGTANQSIAEPITSSAPKAAIQGLRAAARGDAWYSLSPLKAAIAAIESGSAAASVKALDPDLRLAYARGLYAEGQTAAATTQYEKLFAIGKPMQDALLESAWSRLREQNYPKAIGLSHEMQTGKLAGFFAPEAPAILAIAFVENCRPVGPRLRSWPP